MIIGFIVAGIKDELPDELSSLQDNDFELTIHFPSEFKEHNIQEVVNMMYKKLWAIPTPVDITT
eukprot:6316662-Prorocentrum_lima.AAC.1